MKALVLDNDPGMRALIVMALECRQLEVATAESVEEAEAQLAAAGVLLMDFHLGGGRNGAELARRWAGEGRLPPFWLVTGTPEDPEVRALAELPQLQAVIGKPFRLLGLAEAVARILAPSAAEAAAQEPALEGFTSAPVSGPAPDRITERKSLQDSQFQPPDPQPMGPVSDG